MNLDKKQADDWQFILKVASKVMCNLPLTKMERRTQKACRITTLHDSTNITIPPDLARALGEVHQ